MSGLDELDRRSNRVAQRKRTVPRPLHPVARSSVTEPKPVVSAPTTEALPAVAAPTPAPEPTVAAPTPAPEPTVAAPAADVVRDELGPLHPMQIVADDATREALATLKARAGERGIATNQSALMRWALAVAVDDHGVDGFLERIKSAPRRRPGPQRG